MNEQVGIVNTINMHGRSRRWKRLGLSAAVAMVAVHQGSALAGVYQALCAGGSACSVTLMNGQISKPGLTIPKESILSWSQGGSGTKTDVGMGVGGLILFGLPGLIGFAAKKHDYVFSINYVDNTGNIQATAIAFRNNTPANQFMMEMMGMTGLAVGQVNADLQARIERIRAESAEKTRAASLDCARPLKTYNCSWQSYLEANPTVQAWAERNPALVAAEKARLGAVD
jgi:hypothetical protein